LYISAYCMDGAATADVVIVKSTVEHSCRQAEQY